MTQKEYRVYLKAIETYLFKGWKKREADMYIRIVFRDFLQAINEHQYHTGHSFAMARSRVVKALDLIVATKEIQPKGMLEKAYKCCEYVLITYRNNGGTVINRIFAHVETLAKKLKKKHYVTKWPTGSLHPDNYWYSAHKP